MSNGGRQRASLGMEVLKSFQKEGTQRFTVCTIERLDVQKGISSSLGPIVKERLSTAFMSLPSSGRAREGRV